MVRQVFDLLPAEQARWATWNLFLSLGNLIVLRAVRVQGRKQVRYLLPGFLKKQL